MRKYTLPPPSLTTMGWRRRYEAKRSLCLLHCIFLMPKQSYGKITMLILGNLILLLHIIHVLRGSCPVSAPSTVLFLILSAILKSLPCSMRGGRMVNGRSKADCTIWNVYHVVNITRNLRFSGLQSGRKQRMKFSQEIDQYRSILPF